MLKIKRKNMTNGGAYGTYYYVGEGKGVKVFNNPDSYETHSFSTPGEARDSLAWQDAEMEARYLRIAQPSGVVPKCYGAKVIRTEDGKYAVGIVLEHLGRMTLRRKLPRGHRRQDAIYEKLLKQLGKYGVNHYDLHPENVMWYKGKFYAIDFSHECISVDTYGDEFKDVDAVNEAA